MLPFLTAYDPLGSSSGSIDPLGVLQTYGALADFLLPGVTTVTTRSRYLSMMCAALSNVEAHGQILPGASGIAQRRKAIEPFERLWALACVAAREAGHEGAADGLRGVSYAEKAYQLFATSAKRVNCDFQLLKYQSRTGAVGTYWTTLVGGQLIHADTGALAVEGQELAAEFPELPLESKEIAKLADPNAAHRVSLALEDLVAWSEECHLQAAGQQEQKQLGEALVADDRRECVAHALVMVVNQIPELWGNAHLRKLSKALSKIPRAVELGLVVVVEAIDVIEQFHEALLAVFGTLLWWGTINAGRPVADLVSDADFRAAFLRCQETAHSFRAFRNACMSHEVQKIIDGLIGFCFQVEQCHSEREFVAELLDRHRKVQSGKLDGGMPKREWISWDGTTLLRPSPRFQRNERPKPARGVSLTHPYRLEPFVYMLRENRILPSN